MSAYTESNVEVSLQSVFYRSGQPISLHSRHLLHRISLDLQQQQQLWPSVTEETARVCNFIASLSP